MCLIHVVRGEHVIMRYADTRSRQVSSVSYTVLYARTTIRLGVLLNWTKYRHLSFSSMNYLIRKREMFEEPNYSCNIYYFLIINKYIHAHKQSRYGDCNNVVRVIFPDGAVVEDTFFF